MIIFTLALSSNHSSTCFCVLYEKKKEVWRWINVYFIRDASHLLLFPKKAIIKLSFIKRLIGLSSCPTVKLHYQLCRVFHFASRCIHMRADLQLWLLVEMQSSAKLTSIPQNPAWRSATAGGIIRLTQVLLTFFNFNSYTFNSTNCARTDVCFCFFPKSLHFYFLKTFKSSVSYN